MRSPLELWLQEHRDIIEHADRLAELLAPSDIQARLVAPDQEELRLKIAGHFEAFLKMARGHFRCEEEQLVPAIRRHLDPEEPAIRNALGCLEREHTQMHRFTERAMKLLPALRGEKPPKPTEAAEILRVGFGIQSILRHHCTKEEQDVYPLINELPLKVVEALFESAGPSEDIPLNHLVKPLGG